MLLEKQVALVTGSSRGIGKAIAAAFAREGAICFICGRKQETLENVARELAGLPGRVVPYACHVGRMGDLERLVDTALKESGKIDIVVNNAATNVAQGPSLSIDDGQFDKMIEVNLKSAFRLVRLAAPGMCQRGSGAIINVASIAGLRPQFEGLMYSATKAALIMMTKCWALELGPKGVRVNAIAPGVIRTVLSEYYWRDEARADAILRKQPVKNFGEPEDVASIAVLLATNRYMTGETVVVDGGSTLA
jgi:NAD(P)-dependent dehydrogenase (short-subunit alcohol dehydrogenase family)